MSEVNKTEEILGEDLTEEVKNEIMVGAIKLSKPFTYDGGEITEIPYDFDKLTGAQLSRVCKGALNDPKAELAVFSLASGIPETELSRLPGRDWLKVKGRATAFFFMSLAE